MKKISPPRGMHDTLPEDFFLRESMLATIRRVYEEYGYVPIETPAMEKLEILSGKSGESTEKLMFKVLKRGIDFREGAIRDPADLALRYDLTISLCRFYATNYHRLPAVFRRYQIGTVWRADRPQYGRFREFLQCDVDIIGESSYLAECEVVLATVKALDRVGFRDFFVKLSHRGLLPAILEEKGFPTNRIDRTMISIDKLDKLDFEAVIEEVGSHLGGGRLSEFEDFLRGITESPDIPPEAGALGKWGEACAGRIKPILDNLKNIRKAIMSVTEHPIPVRFSPSLVRGMAYYTGPIFEIWDAEHPFSLAGGGRYDGVIGVLLGKEIPACGFSIGIERLLTVLKETGAFDTRRTKARVLVGLREEGSPEVALRVGEVLRDAGIPAEVYLSPAKMKKQFKHAEQQKIHWIVIPRGDGDPAGDYELRDVRSRESVVCKWNDLLARLRRDNDRL